MQDPLPNIVSTILTQLIDERTSQASNNITLLRTSLSPISLIDQSKYTLNHTQPRTGGIQPHKGCSSTSRTRVTAPHHRHSTTRKVRSSCSMPSYSLCWNSASIIQRNAMSQAPCSVRLNFHDPFGDISEVHFCQRASRVS